MKILNDQNDTSAAIHALRSEKNILSSMMKEPAQWIGRAMEAGLSHEHFYGPVHRALFEVLRELYVKGEEIEMVSFIQLLHERDILGSIGGSDAVMEILSFAANADNFDKHLKLVKDKHILRSLIQRCINASNSPYETNHLLENLGLPEGVSTDHDFSIRDRVEDVLERFQNKLSKSEMPLGLSTGFEELDRMVDGLQPGKLYVIASRPAMGKTALMLNITEHICMVKKVPTLIYSGEMRSTDILDRLVFSRAKFALSQLSRGYTPTKGDLRRIQAAAHDLADANLIVDDTPGLSIEALCARARRAKRERGIGFLAIDHLHLLKSYIKLARKSREREVAVIFSGIKSLAKELGVPILVLAQLRRDPYRRDGHLTGIPQMSDLRDSSAIENDADMVGLLYRSAYYAETEEEMELEAGKAKLVLSKNQNGPTGWVQLTFIADLVRFEEWVKPKDFW